MAVRIEIRSDTSANWASSGTVAAANELVYATDTLDLRIGDGVNTFTNLKSVNANAQTAATNAANSASAAAASAAQAAAPTDGQVSTLVQQSGSQTQTAMNGRYVHPWQPNTAYTSGQPAVSPNGDVVTAKTGFTSGSSYVASNWNLSATFVQSGALIALTSVVGPAVQDLNGDDIVQFAPAGTSGKRWDIRNGSASSPTAGGGPSVKISQTENITNLATQMNNNPGMNELNAALAVQAKGLPGSLAQTNAVMITADGAPSGTDVCALGASGRMTGTSGTGFGAYLQGRRDTSTARAIGAEIRAQNEGGVDGTFGAGGGNTVGVWVTTAGTGGYKNSEGVAVASGDGASEWLTGFHATTGSCVNEAFRDDSSAGASFRALGSHTYGIDLYNSTYSGYAINLPATTNANGGIAMGNDTFLYRNGASSLRVGGALSVSGQITSDVMGWQTPVLGNSWINVSGEQQAQYQKMPDGTVVLRGSISSGTTGAAIFTLPAGYRPTATKREVFMSIGGSGMCEIDILSTGVVQVAQYMASGSNSFVSLSGIRFATN